MMKICKKKYKNKGLCLCILMLISLILIPNNVEAKKKSSSNDSNSAADNACSNAFYNGDMFSSSQDGSNYYVKVSAKEGVWNIKYYYGEVDEFDYSNVESASPNGSFTYKGGAVQTITVAKLDNSQLRLVVIAELQGDTKSNPPKAYDKDGKVLKVTYKDGNTTKTTTCRPGNVELSSKSNFSITGTGAVITKIVKAKSSKVGRNLSPEEQAECEAMVQGKFNIGDTSPYLLETDIEGYKKQMTQSFPYCYGSKYAASYDITAKTIKKIRQASLKAYKQYAEFLRSTANNDEYNAAVAEIEAEGYKLLEYSPNGISPKGMLSCTKDQVTERTEKYYTRHTEVDGTKDDNACNVVCQEQIQVTYDPPVATKAGLCFQYKVTVKSKVTCKVDLTTKIKWPTPPSSCSYSPICSGNEQETQAGPNDKFDNCIKNCDGGKYTQSCINSCYNKVYKNKSNTIKKTAADITAKVEKLARTSGDPYYADSKCNSNSKIQNNLEHCKDFFYKTKQKYPMGYYKKASSNSPKWMDYVWQPCWRSSNNNCSTTDDNDKEISYTIDKTTGSTSVENMVEAIKRSSPYYFRTKEVALKTIQSLYGQANGVNGYGTPRKYNIDNGGIKRQMTTTYQCPEVCGFVQDDDNAANCKKSDKEVRKHYVDAFDKITSQLEKCTTSAACKEDTAEFQINADNSVMKDQDTKNKSSFSAQNKTNSDSKTCYNPSGDIKMFIPLVTDLEKGVENSECNINPNGINGKCYGKDNPTYWQHYKTTITYPGTWINLKTAKRYYREEGFDINTVREKKNYYCTGYDFEPVNEQWWKWKLGPESCPGTNGVAEDMTKIDNISIQKDDNITAKIFKFGKYNWSFDLKCFYALSNLVCPPDIPTPKSPPSGGGSGNCDDENSTEICNAEFRPVAISNLFPAKEGTREPGFNWTSAAKDNTIKDDTAGYGIDPGKYAEKIQAEAAGNDEANYSGVADYTVHLTKANIKSLREYAKKNGYTLYEGNNKNPVTGVEGLYYYKSNLLGDNTYTTDFSRNVSLGINNN